MTQTMKAAVMYGPNDIRVEQVPKPVCDEDGMIVKVEAVGLCGSDIRHLTTDSRNGDYPYIFGHEHAGVVAEIGPKAKTDLKVGDRAFVSPVLPYEGAHAASGGFAEYMSLSAWNLETSNVLPLPDHVPFEHVIITEPLSLGVFLPGRGECENWSDGCDYWSRTSRVSACRSGESTRRRQSHHDRNPG